MSAKPRPLHTGAACANVRHRTRWIPLPRQPVGKLETDRPAPPQQRRRGDRSAFRRCVATGPARWLRRHGSYLGERGPRFVVLGVGDMKNIGLDAAKVISTRGYFRRSE